jgi:hypothetical protein
MIINHLHTIQWDEAEKYKMSPIDERGKHNLAHDEPLQVKGESVHLGLHISSLYS